MKFGCSFNLTNEPWVIAKYAKLVEDTGFDDIWCPDHYWYYDSFVAHALIAQNTKKVGIGANVFGAYLRHPGLFASSVATIDNMSGGRAIFGIGPGGWEFPTELCYDYSKPRSAVRDTFHIVRELWKGNAVTYNGKVFKVKNAKLQIETRPDILVYMSARGPLMFKLAGEICDGSITHGLTSKYIDYTMKQIGKGLKKAGRDLKEIDVGLVPAPLRITNDRESTIKKLKPRMLGFITGIGSEGREMLDLLDLPYEAVLKVREVARTGAPRSEIAGMVDDDLLNKLIDAFTIVGTAEECISKMESLERQGVSHINVGVSGEPSEWKKQIGSLGKIVQSFKE